MRQRFRFLTLLLWLPLAAGAQTLKPSDYIFPIRGVQGLYAANFGEMRPNHFHAGVDIKTDGIEGKALVAVADGYVSRISLSPTGYGRALYLTLDNGTTAVYGHICRFRNDIEEYLLSERLRLRQNRLDLYLQPEKFRVMQGDTVAFSGNSGTSFGPHLHFELRHTATQRTLNTVRQGIIRPHDDIPPYILRIHYIETDTVRGIPVHREAGSYETQKVDKNTYRLLRRDPIPIGRNGYFVVETTDRRNNVSNTFGIYRATLAVDGRARFEYRMDGFTFDHSRDCNAASYYPRQLSSRNEFIRLAAIDGACRDFCPVCEGRGVIRASEGELLPLEISVEDDCGNTSHIRFEAKGRRAWQADNDLQATACRRMQTTRLSTDSAKLTIPAGALYESIFLRIGRSECVPRRDTSLVVLSPVYKLIDRTTPLKQAVEVTITARIPESLQPHAALAVLNEKGGISHVGGRYNWGRVTAYTTTAGDMLIVADTVPPTIRPLFAEGADLTHAQELAFRIGDNFSGITSCELYIDQEWVPCDRLPIKGTVFHKFRSPGNKKQHIAHLIVRDGCGNKTIWQGRFLR